MACFQDTTHECGEGRVWRRDPRKGWARGALRLALLQRRLSSG